MQRYPVNSTTLMWSNYKITKSPDMQFKGYQFKGFYMSLTYLLNGKNKHLNCNY